MEDIGGSQGMTANDRCGEEPGFGGSPRASILLVDDEARLLTVNTRLLEAIGFEVHAAPGGAEAVEFLHQHDVDLIVLDMVMPGMDGVATMREIRDFKPDQKIIILSAFSEAEQTRQARELGALAYVQKPSPIDVLTETIEQALAI